jgi:dipeptidyl-peptidase-4
LLKGEYRATRPAESRWLDEGERYTVLEPSAAHADQSDLVAYETATGKRTILVPAQELTPTGARKPLDVEDYSWSDDGQHLLIFTNSQRVWRSRTRGDYWVLTLSGAKLTRLGGSAPEATLMFASFSPDGRLAAYVRANNLYTEELATGKITELVTDGSPDRINGTADWVTEEEFFLHNAYRWSPDSKSIAYWQFDESGVDEYTLIDDTTERSPKFFRYKYPQAGTTNAAVRVGVVSAEGGSTQWIKLPGDARNHYVPRMDWVGHSNALAVEYLNRPQNTEQILLANAQTGEVRVLFEDKDAAYLDVIGWLESTPHFKWLGDAAQSAKPAAGSVTDRNQANPDLLWLSERDGWRHAYLVSSQTGQFRLITNFAADVIAPLSVDQKAGYFYFEASPSDPIRTYLYRSRLDGTGTPERVTPAGERGTNHYDMAPNSYWAIHTFMTADQPPNYDIVQLPEHRSVRTMVTNTALAQKVKTFKVPSEFLATPVKGGVQLSTLMVKPPDFDPHKKYPVLVNVYGEPGAQTVLDSWSLLPSLFAHEGYITISFDNEGTPAPRGRAWRRAGFGAIGVLSTEEQGEAIRTLARQYPFIDTSRMAIFGWSGGGTNTLNMMFRNPGLFTTGIAVAPVPDQTRYDTIYQERYMGMPAENVKGYHDGSAINFAGGLTGNLLVVHGSGDDNVHFQGTELLVNKLIELGKPFEFMDYPNRTHCICEGPGTSLHVYSLIGRYLEEHVPPGPQ